MSSEDDFQPSEGQEEASRLFQASRRIAYVIDKWITPLNFDLLGEKITVSIAAGHRGRMLQALRDCELKLLALKYHLDNMVRLRDKFTSEDRQIIELSKATEQKSISTPIDFELEAFLLQARSCLEVFCQIIASRLQLSRVKPSNVKRILAGRNENFASRVKNQIESHPLVWRIVQGEGETTLRDWIAHYGRITLTGLHTKVDEKGITYRGPLLSEEVPMPASMFAGAVLHDLEHVVKDSLAEMFDRPPPGEGDFLVSDKDVMQLGRAKSETPTANEK